ncbi:nucleolin-like [Anopheles maculipalpis]|uniref:nucleolin-like n=1 Tax=Anopheles maculipalpis TaxID=1496333 RepID=UPI0021592850|nr:nucleolin-like [Anopheles maculipalpis]
MSKQDTATFFSQGTSAQFDHVLALYPQVLKLRAENKCKKPDELIRLDDWYQNKLPQLIKKRGKDRFMVHEELVKTMKWKQTRGKFYPQLSYLIKVNTPRAVQAETKKAFRKLPNLEQAITALSNLKGVGTTMASALLAAAAPETAPFMADECLMAIPEIEGIDYTTREYMNFVQHIQATTDRLNRECHPADCLPEQPTSSVKRAGNGTTAKDGNTDDSSSATTSDEDDSLTVSPTKKSKPDTSKPGLKAHEKKWSPHKVELALWTHYVASELQPDILEHTPLNGKSVTDTVDPNQPASPSNPAKSDVSMTTNGNSTSLVRTQSNHVSEDPSDESNFDTEHEKSALGSDESSKDHKFVLDSLDDCTKSEDSMERPSAAAVTNVTGKKPFSGTARRKTAKNSGRCAVASDDSLSSPKPSIERKGNSSGEEEEEQEKEEEDEETVLPPSKKTKVD